ncbi:MULTISPECIES: transglycosylase SLT domain-containing protein [Klebsiella]|nr:MULTISPECIES: transglycosylase SLT domain-containing protein [Klebsiella]HCA9702890.1 transglycosylase SLT domain-containing protein [Klebsiella variicola subsp. variicola]MBX4663557.1 Lytic transglycosylase, catalytic [Klebsiella michiganensis]MCW9328041.1 transglycosylase SLT domain-containing protein [Klebsiella pneumoniae]MDA3998264.1 transglycosylase SLT domain-containing protein [Klebsiella pneumoniae]MEC5704271.1 transglycosylase SLT domain-containing protein [Klebsiella variicola]
MPTVPTVQGRQVESRGVSSSGFQTFEQPNIGDALVNVGSQALDVFGQAKQQADLALTQDATQRLYAVGSGLMDDPKEGLMTLQGKNAIGQAPGYIQKFDNEMQTIAGTLPESARNVFLKHAQQQRMQFATQAERHELGQRRQYESGQQDGYLSLQAQQAISNPQLFNQSALNARASIMAYGQAHGQSPEEIESNWVQWREQAANRASESWYTPMYQQLLGPNGRIEVSDTPSESQLFSAMIWQESGGNQYGKDGAPLVSPKGAVGVAQVMEDTGPEAARLAGVPWDRDKWLNDPRYNAKLGQAYFGAQMKRYDNNPVLAVAAYNAGPGSVDSWIKQFGDPRTGAVSNEQFAAAIPYDETRNYVAKVTGSAPAIPGAATMENLINQPFWDAMSPQNKSAMMSKVAGMYDMQAAAGRVSLQSRMQDDMAKLEAGQSVNPISEREWLAVMPLQASPAERMQLEKTYQQYQQAMSLQPVYQTIVKGNYQQGLAAVQSIQPKQDETDSKYKSELYASAVSKLQQVHDAREADPGTWLQQYSPVVQSAFQQYQNSQVTGEYLASRIQAEKERLGIRSKSVLPASIVDGISAKVDSGNMNFSDLKGIISGFGRYGDSVVAQLQPKTKAAVRVATAINDPNAADTMFTIRNVKTEELKKNAGEQAKGVDAAWNSLISAASPTFSLQRQGGAETLADINEQGKRLAYYYMASGEDAQAATEKAYKKMIGDHYTVTDTWRMPNNLGLKENNVTDGLSNIVNSLKIDDIGSRSMFYIPTMTPEQNAANNLAQIQNSAEWVTDENEQGVYLTVNGTPILDQHGAPIHVSFADASKSGIAKPSTTGAVLNWMGEKRKVTPPSEFYTPNVNATMSDAFRVLRGQDATSPLPQKETDNPSNTLRDALNTRGGQ